jgi:hypothetical protein
MAPMHAFLAGHGECLPLRARAADAGPRTAMASAGAAKITTFKKTA